jgi:DNA replicative helicase MCM subunit Mcm2 (Cdc46/Mcm family)
VYDELSEGKPGMFGSVTSRAEAYVIRLALIYALLDCSDEIWEEHLQAALAVWEYCESSAKFIFGDATGNPTADAILKALRQTPEGLSRTDISALFDRNKDAKTINTALEVLAAQGRAKKGGVRPIRGRPSETWIAVGA